MTVNPGWGGQPFMPELDRQDPRLRELVGPDVAIEVDGGVDAGTGGACAEAGATWFVAGSAVFGAPDPATRVPARSPPRRAPAPGDHPEEIFRTGGYGQPYWSARQPKPDL